MGPSKYKADASLFAYSPYFSAGALFREVERLAAACWKPAGLSPSQGQIMLFLLNFPTIGPTVIARSLLLSPSTVTRLLDGLEKKGLIERKMYRKLHIVSPSNEAWDREEEFLAHDLEFYRRCRTLLGEKQANELIEKMNEATRKLRGIDANSRQEDNRPDGDTKSGEDYRPLLP